MGITNYTDPNPFESDKVSNHIEEDRLKGKIKDYENETVLPKVSVLQFVKKHILHLE